jgi:tripartite-type tricarboxylate transporter receptor subunit TctC
MSQAVILKFTPGFRKATVDEKPTVQRGNDMRGFRLMVPLAVLAALAGAPLSSAQDFPSHVVKLVVPAASGSTTDTIARLLADSLGKAWSQSVIVENVAGGAMNIGADHVSHSAPDGYTLMVSPPSPISINHLLYRDLSYDPRQFVPVALLAKIPNALVVRKDLPAASVKELIAYGKANPGKLTYGSQGAGSTAHLSASQLEVLAGIKMVHVPYRGALPALNDVIAAHIDMFFDTLTTSVPLWRGDKVRILAVASPERSPDVPELPTVAEAGLPGFRSITWFALVAPPGTPAAVITKINGEVNAAFRELGEKFHTLRLTPMPGSAADAARFIADETTLWGRVIKEANITAQ